MPVWVALVFGGALLVFVLVRRARRASSGRTGVGEGTASAVTSPTDLVVVPTGRDCEVLVLGDEHVVAGIGKEISRLPRQIVERAAAAMPGAAESLTNVGRASGRLVLVDGEFARALKSGAVAKDAAGKVLPQIRGSNGTVVKLARITDVANPATLTSAAGLASAMATQAQLARIEAAIQGLSDQLRDIGLEADMEREALRWSAAGLLEDVYAAARSAETLSDDNWDVVKSNALDFSAYLKQDASRLEASVKRLETLSADTSARTRQKEVEEVCAEIAKRQAQFVSSARSWLQYSELRLWRMQITQDPSIGHYTGRLRSQLEHWAKYAELEGVVNESLERLGTVKWTQHVVHGISARRIPKTVSRTQQQIGAVPWSALGPSHEG